jgi:IS30 family transposase
MPMVQPKPSLRSWAGCPPARAAPSYDNGGEFARHETVTKEIGLRLLLRSAQSVAAILNRERQLRRDLPRKTSLGGYSDADIDDVIWNLNATPRKCLGYRTPIEAFAANLGVALGN